MNHPATQDIFKLLHERNVMFRVVTHPPCRTSEESAKARAAGGGGVVCGAKAIVVKAKRKLGGSEFDVFVLPGPAKIISKLLLAHLTDIKDFRFATPAELAEHTGGLLPGMMPPFGRPIFVGIDHLFVDASLLEQQLIGFNAADLTQSIVVGASDYVAAAAPTEIFSFSSNAEA